MKLQTRDGKYQSTNTTPRNPSPFPFTSNKDIKINTDKESRPMHNCESTLGPITPSLVLLSGNTELALRVIVTLKAERMLESKLSSMSVLTASDSNRQRQSKCSLNVHLFYKCSQQPESLSLCAGIYNQR